MITLIRTPLLTALVALSAAVTLVACDQPGKTSVGQKIDGAIADVKSESQSAADKAKTEVRELAKDTQQAAGQAATAVATGAADMTITAKINAALAADSKLSALKIDVDTSQGRVKLMGTAPDAQSKDRATTMAAAVEGVSGVDNRLMVSK